MSVKGLLTNGGGVKPAKKSKRFFVCFARSYKKSKKICALKFLICIKKQKLRNLGCIYTLNMAHIPSSPLYLGGYHGFQSPF